MDIVVANRGGNNGDETSQAILRSFPSLPIMDRLAHTSFTIVSKAIKIWAIKNNVYGVKNGINSVGLCIMLMAIQKENDFATIAESFTKFFAIYGSFDFNQTICIEVPPNQISTPSSMKILLPTTYGQHINVAAYVNPDKLEKIKRKLFEAKTVLNGQDYIKLFIGDESPEKRIP